MESAAEVHGGWNSWMWMPSTLGVVLPFGWQFQRGRADVGADGAVAALVGLGGEVGAAAQLRPHAGVRLRRATLGVYATVAVNTLSDAQFHVAGGPYVDIPLCDRKRKQHCDATVSLFAGASETHYGKPTGFLPTTWIGGARLRWGLPRRR